MFGPAAVSCTLFDRIDTLAARPTVAESLYVLFAKTTADQSWLSCPLHALYESPKLGHTYDSEFGGATVIRIQGNVCSLDVLGLFSRLADRWDVTDCGVR